MVGQFCKRLLQKHETVPFTRVNVAALVVMGTTGIKGTHTALLYELALTATRCVSGQCCEVKQHSARLVVGWVTQALEQG